MHHSDPFTDQLEVGTLAKKNTTSTRLPLSAGTGNTKTHAHTHNICTHTKVLSILVVNINVPVLSVPVRVPTHDVTVMSERILTNTYVLLDATVSMSRLPLSLSEGVPTLNLWDSPAFSISFFSHNRFSCISELSPHLIG